MKDLSQRTILTGFMGVGKSTVSRHLAYLLKVKRQDLDDFIIKMEGRSIPEILKTEGVNGFREIETRNLKKILKSDAGIIALGGGAWTIPENRDLIREHKIASIWLESTFEHCWRNIKFSRNERPLAKDKKTARRLFEERQQFYCLADWHFVIKSGNNSYDVAKQIAIEVFAF
jgi:shikimate kinase